MDEPPLKILIADDEPLATERLQLLLARSPGVDLVGTASDGEAAVRLAEGLAPDVMLLDIAMPGMSGPELQRELTRHGQAIPTIFITARADQTVRQQLLEPGAVECLFKPFSEEQLRAALAAAFRRN